MSHPIDPTSSVPPTAASDSSSSLPSPSQDPLFRLVHGEAMERGARCDVCPLANCRRGPVPSQIVPNSLMAISGEGPGKHEVNERQNFVGYSGQVLNESLIMGGVNRYAQTVVNVIACRHSEDENESLGDWIKRQERKASRDGREWVSPVEACRGRFARDLDEANSNVLLAVGKYALSSMTEYLRERGRFEGDDPVMSRVHGAPIALDRGYLFATYHPMFAVHDPKWYRFVRDNIKRAAKVAKSGQIDWSEPEYVLFPPLRYMIDWLTYAATYKPELTVDLETCDPETGKPSADPYVADLRCIGTGFNVNGQESVTVFGFRHMDGTFWTYPEEDRRLAKEIAVSWWGSAVVDQWLEACPRTIYAFPVIAEDALVRLVLFAHYRRAFDTCPVNGHNIITFDSPIMLRLGLLSDRMKEVTDTLILHHNTPNQDHQHSLSFVGRELFEVPSWKTKEDIASTDNANDAVLALRCARDVLVTNRALKPLRASIAAVDTTRQNRTDHVVGVRERNACDLGLCVDERMRGFWSRTLGIESERLRAEWYEAVGKDVNPRSPDQLRELFYRDWGLEPALSVDGDVWDPDIPRSDDDIIEPDEGSTGVQAVIGLEVLHERGVQPLTERQLLAFKKLLAFKAVDKPLSTYIHMDVRKWPRDGYSWQLVDQILSAEGKLERRPMISRLQPIASMGRTPVGRAAWKAPAEQQRPKQGRKIFIPAGTLMGDGTYSEADQYLSANMRSIIIAAPGHSLVGADYKQSHIRIYAANAGDWLLYEIIVGGAKDKHGKEIDPHAFNAASLLAHNASELWDWYDKIQYGDKDYREYWRFIAKKYCFGKIYGAIAETLYRTMKAERRRDNGERAFPKLSLTQDCIPWSENWDTIHPWTAPWQQREIDRYEASVQDVAGYGYIGYAMSEDCDSRKRFGPLEHNQIPNHSILAEEGANKNHGVEVLEDLIPHRGWSDWTGLVYDGHDSLVYQVPKGREEYTIQAIEYAMAGEKNGMPYRAEAKVIKTLGHL